MPGVSRWNQQGRSRISRSIFLLLCLTVSQAVPPASRALSAAPQEQTVEGQALVNSALDNELRAAQDLSHPMRYILRKTSPRLTTTRQIYETKDGDVARLISNNDKPLNPDDEQREQARLAELSGDQARQQHRKQSEDVDRERALKILRALPHAFLYQDEGPSQDGGQLIEKFSLRPNPSFSPPDLESQALTQMTGEIWIDPVQQRVVRLEGHLQQDVDFGWGILGRLYKGGWVRIDQSDLGGGQWRTARFQMVMNARIVFKNRNFDTTEEQTQFAPLPPSITWRQAIAELTSSEPASN